MKTILILISLVFISLSAHAYDDGDTDFFGSGVQQCSDNSHTMGGGVDVWPWSFAKPFPWDNIQGFWQLGDNPDAFIKARVLSSNNNRKILSLAVYGEGICSKPYAKGTGYVDVTEKNVVRAILSDGVYRYQLKIGMFDPRDVAGINACSQNIMAASMQVIERASKSSDKNVAPLDPDITETHNMMLKKATVDPGSSCKMMND